MTLQRLKDLVLGIDAAWTEANPSGLALVGKRDGRRTLLALAGSYGDFLALAGIDGNSVADLPAACEAIAGRLPDAVAIDMPLSHDPIVGRRASDNVVSRLWGSRKCATHTPNELRPGAIGVRLHEAFLAAGYTLATTDVVRPALLEVYPHPALVELIGAAERLPYKASKTRIYWPWLSAAERRDMLIAVWAAIVEALEQEIEGVAAALPLPSSDARGASLKAFEDRLDAIICAWVGSLALEGSAAPHGDERSAIWIPTARA